MNKMINKQKMTLTIVFSLMVGSFSFAEKSNISGSQADSQGISRQTSLNLVLFFNSESLKTKFITYDTFDLNSPEGISSLAKAAEFVLDLQKTQKDLKKQGGQMGPQTVVGVDLKQPYNSFDITDGGLKAASQKILQLIEKIEHNIKAEESKYQIAQISRALQQNYTDAYDGDFDILKIPIYLVRYLSKPQVSFQEVGSVETPPFLKNQLQTRSTNLGENLFDFLNLKSDPADCKYSKAKRGYGVHAGFQVECRGDEYKVKFGNEIYSGPFNARIFRAMGYLAPTINYQKALTIPYDRKMFLEINERRAMELSLSFVGVPIRKFTNKKNFDPFTLVKSFRLKNGQEMSGAEGRRALVGSAGLVLKEGLPPEVVTLEDSDFNEEFEKQIAQVVLVPTTITSKDDKTMGTEIGLWSISDLDYSSFKEMQGLMVLSAWIGNYDVRKQNLLVSLVGEGKEKELKMGFADAGSGLGKGTIGLTKPTSSEINDMAWTVTTVQNQFPKDNSGYQQSQGSEAVVLSGLSNMEPNSDFNNIKLPYARWILGEMCKNISKDQLTESLVASGMSSAEIVLAREKLLSRRNQMLVDLEMPNELVQNCSVPANRAISYDPKKDGLVSVYSKIKNARVEAPDNNMIVVKGKVVRRPSAL
ncbi:MAG: hypothetical protein JNM39_07910 [Bdellovibrionaceae bacterium]|nr:hypothetical protein [Pseudobdellovibrionaceae bacterium]